MRSRSWHGERAGEIILLPTQCWMAVSIVQRTQPKYGLCINHHCRWAGTKLNQAIKVSRPAVAEIPSPSPPIFFKYEPCWINPLLISFTFISNTSVQIWSAQFWSDQLVRLYSPTTHPLLESKQGNLNSLSSPVNTFLSYDNRRNMPLSILFHPNKLLRWTKKWMC